MSTRSAQIWVCIMLTGLLCGTGCSNSSSPRSVLQIVNLNDNQPLASDVVRTVTGSATVMEDKVYVEVRNDPHDSVVDLKPGGPFSFVVIDSYRIHFEAEEAIPDVSGGLGWNVASGSSVIGQIVVVPASLKMEAPLLQLWEGNELLATAKITFYGHEVTSNYKLTVETSLPVHFANWAD
jgi:hypothetical protein